MTDTGLSAQTWAFIDSNAGADVRKLAFAKAPDGVDLKAALVQIAGHRIAAVKLPDWASFPRLLYPVHLSMEQCTGQPLALYKSALVREWLCGIPSFRFADLTGGFGVDCFYLSAGCGSCLYNEMNPELCSIAAWNFPLLGRGDIDISNMEASAFLETLHSDSLDIVYLDPARRDGSGHKLVSIADCSPNVVAMQNRLLDVSARVLVKLSPMLDIKKVLSELSCVSRVMAVSVDGECKELLVFMERGFAGDALIQAVNLDGCGVAGTLLGASFQEEQSAPLLLDTGGLLLSAGNYLYEPYASVMKSGLFHTLSGTFGVAQVGEGSHLFVSKTPVHDFPGRSFRIDRTVPFDRRSAAAFFDGIGRANIAVRNFPLTADELRRRFKVPDGGPHYVFATIACSGRKLLVDCSKCS